MIPIIALILSLVAVNTARADERFITLSSTTSTQDSGLFGYILPIFRAATDAPAIARLATASSGCPLVAALFQPHHRENSRNLPPPFVPNNVVLRDLPDQLIR